MSLGVPGGKATPPLGGQEGGGKESPLPHPLVGFSLTFIFFLSSIKFLSLHLHWLLCLVAFLLPSLLLGRLQQTL